MPKLSFGLRPMTELYQSSWMRSQATGNSGGACFPHGFGRRGEIVALLGIDFLVDLSRQGLEFLVVPLRIVLRPVLAIPGVEVVGGVEQCRYEAPDRQVVIAARTIGKPYRVYYRAQIAFDAERFFEHRLDRLRP